MSGVPFPPNPPENPYRNKAYRGPVSLYAAYEEGFVAAGSWWRSRLVSDETVEAVARELHIYEHGDEMDYARPDYQDAARVVLAALLPVAGGSGGRSAPGNFRAANLPAEKPPCCGKCNDTGMIPDPDRGSGWGPYWDTPCDCAAVTEKPETDT